MVTTATVTFLNDFEDGYEELITLVEPIRASDIF